MSALNPYESFLDGRPLDVILTATPNAIAEYLEVIGAEKARVEPAPGKWSAAEIVAHLADCELVFGFRLRQTLAEDNPTIQPFDQDKWAWASQYANLPAPDALAAFSGLRKWNLLLIHNALSQSGERPMTHPERGTMTFRNVVETMAGHDLNHLAQLRRIAGQSA
jgi:uncharacterized damage-inducible protein DinB